MLKNKNILIGITGGIAAYKTATLVRLLKRQGANVKVVMSKNAKDFITPLTMATLSGNPILVDNFDPENGAWNSHISLGEWADLYVIAPATANTIAKMACGIADNLLLCTYLSARCGVWIAPAMDYDMYLHKTTQENLTKIEKLGIKIIEPGEGFLASGLVGKGRMCEPEEIAEHIVDHFTLPKLNNIRGKKILITAGATVENIDPVRFISNYSTGKMGYAIADRLALCGAEVILVSGSATAQLRCKDIEKIDVVSADDMYAAVDQRFANCDIAIFCAAVADYAPCEIAATKIKHENKERLTLELKANPDIAASMGKIKRNNQITVGFALETDNEEYNATRKLSSKNFDAIVLNSLADKGAGFATNTNKITIIEPNQKTNYNLKSKQEVASDIAEWLDGYIGRK